MSRSLSESRELRARLIAAGPSALDDLEALQLAAGLIAQQAAALVIEFGSLPEVLGASRGALRRLTPEAAAARVELMKDIARRLLVSPLHERPLMPDWTVVADYLRAMLSGLPREQFRVLFLDRRHRLIRDEVMGEGTVDHAPAYPREVLRRALIGQADEPAQDIYVAQVARQRGHHLFVQQRLVLVGRGGGFAVEVVAADQAGALLGLGMAQVVEDDIEGDAGQQRLGVAEVAGVAGEPQEGLLGEVLGQVAADPAGQEGEQPGEVGAVEGGDLGGEGGRADKSDALAPWCIEGHGPPLGA
jgi:DNA repair protein RadC